MREPFPASALSTALGSAIVIWRPLLCSVKQVDGLLGEQVEKEAR